VEPNLKERSSNDFRLVRNKLPPEAFAYAKGPELPPTDLVDEKAWYSITGLPDDVALRTSDHHGSQLKAMHDIWGDWIRSVPDEQDAINYTMLDSADALQACTFNALSGYYQVAASCLRSALELNVIGAYFQLLSKTSEFDRFKKGEYEVKFGNACECLFDHPSTQELHDYINSKMDYSIFAKKPHENESWARNLYSKLSHFAHSRPTHSAVVMWEGSNGPIYVTNSFGRIYALYLDTMSLSYVLVKLARPTLKLPRVTRHLFRSPKVRPSKVALYAFQHLWPEFQDGLEQIRKS